MPFFLRSIKVLISVICQPVIMIAPYPGALSLQAGEGTLYSEGVRIFSTPVKHVTKDDQFIVPGDIDLL